uniref:hypothetical protein n=1 Tax=Mycobacterium tuberculosis TaxID=1773 RepID=UPI00254CFDAF
MCAHQFFGLVHNPVHVNAGVGQSATDEFPLAAHHAAGRPTGPVGLAVSAHRQHQVIGADLAQPFVEALVKQMHEMAS